MASESNQASRTLLERGTVTAKVVRVKAEGQKFKDYFDWNEPIAKTPSHRLLALRRGEKEGILTLDIFPPEESATDLLERQYIKGASTATEQVKLAVHDSYKRLLRPSLETEIRMETKMKADEEAIKVFATNLKRVVAGCTTRTKMYWRLIPVSVVVVKWFVWTEKQEENLCIMM